MITELLGVTKRWPKLSNRLGKHVSTPQGFSKLPGEEIGFPALKWGEESTGCIIGYLKKG